MDVYSTCSTYIVSVEYTYSKCKVYVYSVGRVTEQSGAARALENNSEFECIMKRLYRPRCLIIGSYGRKWEQFGTIFA